MINIFLDFGLPYRTELLERIFFQTRFVIDIKMNLFNIDVVLNNRGRCVTF